MTPLWRRVSLGMPELWTSIYVWVPELSYNDERSQVVIEMMDAVLDRAAGEKLHVHVDTDAVAPRETRRFFTLLRSTCADWVSLTLRGTILYRGGWHDQHYLGHPIFPEAKDETGFSSLETIDIEDMVTYEYRDKLLKALENASQLRSIKISSYPRKRLLNAPVPTFPWSHLTTFESSPASQPWSFQALSNCPNLRVLVISGATPSSHWTTDGFPSVTLRKVQKLRISFRDHNSHYDSGLADLPTVCQKLNLPALKDLEVEDVGLNANLDALLDLIERSKCTVKSLSFAGVTLMDESILRFLRMMPDVASLALKGLLFPLIFHAMSSVDLLPNLQHLLVSPPLDSVLPENTAAAVVDMLKARSLTAGGLETAFIATHDDPERGLTAQLTEIPHLKASVRHLQVEHVVRLSQPDSFRRLLNDIYAVGNRGRKGINILTNVQILDRMFATMEASGNDFSNDCRG
ncbi:hypothetical protein V5O48_013705, partial [Marasmius crinis-equi]